jgi:tripartite-type tricarboxylate transporter receptor subunit TctC
MSVAVSGFKHHLLETFVVAFTLTCSGAIAQENYPSRPIRMVVPFAAGGPTDIVARVMGRFSA